MLMNSALILDALKSIAFWLPSVTSFCSCDADLQEQGLLELPGFLPVFFASRFLFMKEMIRRVTKRYLMR